MSKRLSLILFLLVITTSLLLVVSAGAQSSPTTKPNPDPAVFSSMVREITGIRGPDIVDDVAINTWSRIAYQKYADDNWDIYLYDSKGSERLTTNAADDVFPAINRGGTAVAFASDRNDPGGPTDLYTINVDKTGLKQIAAGWTAFPAWSPNGKTIAFQGWVNGQYDIFIVDVDGSNLRRLTNNPDFDGQPAWSPDGQEIAFASRRGGQYSIYIMKTDASALRKLTSYPLSLHPTWSPDGDYIGFDADVDGDGWQELAVIQIDGSDQKMIYDPGTSATSWAGSWSPGGDFLGFTDIHLILDGGIWYWTEGFLRQWGRLSNSIQLLVPGNTNWYMDWATLDVIPPETSIGPVKPYSRADQFAFAWSGIDYGGSGLKDYTVYYRNSSDGDWKTYWRDTIATAAAFPGTPGETTDFFVHARDNAYNLDFWENQQVVSTTFYNTRISGDIRDNVGVPLSDVPISIVPAPMFPAKTNFDGWFEGYTVPSGVFTLSANISGYKPMPETNTIPDEDFLRIMTLLPEDTLLANGTFETSADQPTGWQTGGGLPVNVTSNDQATGKNSVRIGGTTTNANDDSVAIAIGTLTQEVTIPLTMDVPVLSLMAKSVGDQPGDGSGLEVVIVPDGGSEIVLYNGVIYPWWTIYAFSAQPWKGQKVEIIFRVTQDSNDPPLTIYLDDASLGSAHPELWVEMSAVPQAALIGQTVKLNIIYGNKGGVEAKNGKIEVNLDPAMSFVSADPPATQNGNVLSWTWPTLVPRSGPDLLTVHTKINSNPGADMKVTAQISNDTAEAHLANNQSVVFVKNKAEIFMPLVGVNP